MGSGWNIPFSSCPTLPAPKFLFTSHKRSFAPDWIYVSVVGSSISAARRAAPLGRKNFRLTPPFCSHSLKEATRLAKVIFWKSSDFCALKPTLNLVLKIPLEGTCSPCSSHGPPLCPRWTVPPLQIVSGHLYHSHIPEKAKKKTQTSLTGTAGVGEA